MTECSPDDPALWRRRRVLITGGVGFIGSTPARRLVELGARVSLVDSLIPEYGGNLFDLAGQTSQPIHLQPAYRGRGSLGADGRDVDGGLGVT